MGYIVLLLPFLCVVSGTSDRRLKDFTRTDFIEFATTKIDNDVPPNYEDDYPTEVECGIRVDSFDSINEAAMDFTLTILLHLQWTDRRFSPYLPKTNNDSYVEIDSKNLQKLWFPDLYFPNEKKAYFHDVFMLNKMMKIYSGGRVSYAVRLSLTLSCPMDLRRYPFDKQRCPIEIESFSYNDQNINLKWVNKSTQEDPVFVDQTISFPQFEIKDIQTKEYLKYHTGSGNHSCLKAEFLLVRNIGYYLVQMYIPSILVVMLSWISFWLNVGAVPGRISLGVLTVLTMSTQSSSVNASLPRVSYTKAIDIWMATCLLFVFLALIEFAVANVLSRKDMNKGFKFKDLFKIPAPNEKTPLTTKMAKSDNKDLEEGSSASKKKVIRSGVIYAMYMDVGSRIAFPAFFIVFNIVYWSIFLSGLHNNETV